MKPHLSLSLLALSLAAVCWSMPAAAEDADIPTARVVIPWSDFKTLYERDEAPEEKPEVAPRDYTLSKARYEGRVEGDSTLFQLDLKLEILKEKGWVTIPLLPTAVALRQARMGGRDAPIYQENGWYYLITDRRGVLDMELEFAVSTWESGGQMIGYINGVEVGRMAPSAGTGIARTVPSTEPLEFEVSNAQRVATETRGGDQLLSALVPASGNLSVIWQGTLAEEEVVEAQVRVYAEHQALVGVGEGLLQCSSAIHYSILHAGVEDLSVTLPSDVTVLDVRGNGIRDWQVVPGDARQQVAVDLNYEAKGSYSLYVDYERPLPDGSAQVVVPNLQVEGVERVKGWVGIDARSNLEIASGAAQDATAVDVRDLPTAILGQTDWPVLLAFKYRKESYSIPLEIRQHQDVDMLVTIIDTASATTVMTPDGRRMTQMVYSVRNNRAQFLRLVMPEGAEPWSTFVGGKSVKPALQGDGRLLVPLARSQTSGGALAQFAVEMVYVEEGDSPDSKGKGVFQATLPKADVPVTLYNWTVYLPSDARVKEKKIEGTLRHVDYFTSISSAGYQVQDLYTNEMVQQQANQQFESDALAEGVQPVRVSLPIDGWALYFEKLLVLDEDLGVEIPYKGLK